MSGAVVYHGARSPPEGAADTHSLRLLRIPGGWGWILCVNATQREGVDPATRGFVKNHSTPTCQRYTVNRRRKALCRAPHGRVAVLWNIPHRTSCRKIIQYKLIKCTYCPHLSLNTGPPNLPYLQKRIFHKDPEPENWGLASPQCFGASVSECTRGGL